MYKILSRKNSNKIIFSLFLVLFCSSLQATEVIEPTDTKVVVREHPKTRKPYVSIVSNQTDANGFFLILKPVSRPDYRMLDPKIKSGEIPYDGPYSDSKRIYIFAATLAMLGTVGGAVGIAAIPASATGAASGGAGYLVAGGAVAAGTTGAALSASQTQEDDFTQSSSSRSSVNKIPSKPIIPDNKES